MPANIDPAKLKAMSPFRELNASHINDLLKQGETILLGDGKVLFKRGESDDFAYWLIEGSVDLLDADFEVTKVDAGNIASHGQLDASTPHKLTAVSTAASVVFKIKRSALHLVFSLDEAGDYMISSVSEVHDTQSDWMSSLLSSPLFDFVPPANIQELFTKFEEVAFEQGDIVIRQGDPGDFFYVIQSGKVRVELESGDKKINLAEPGPGAFFGEDALVSDVPRNATITMLSDGKLMRLSKPDFESLLQAPLIEQLSLSEAREMIASADPKTYILDVRSSREFQQGKLKGSINLPLMSLRKNLGKLKDDAVYIARSDGDKRAQLAAYILNGNGFTAYVLDEHT
jgi:CRP-like cAMP-binding protein